MVKRDQQMSDQDLEQLCALFRLLSDKTRLYILMKLAEGERNVTKLCDELNLPQPTVSHHLGLLRMHNMVGNRRAGKQVLYILHNNGQNRSLMNFAVQHLEVHVQPREQ